MRRWVTLGLSALLVSVLGLFALPPAASAQLTFVENAPQLATPLSEVDELIERGQKLEIERRWGEALTLYEEALRSHPKDAQLEDSVSRSRGMHYDLGRRYNDNSFREAVRTLSLGDALDLYSEVLAKINSHYVNVPDWDQLSDYGTRTLEAAWSIQSLWSGICPTWPRLRIRSLPPRTAAATGHAEHRPPRR